MFSFNPEVKVALVFFIVQGLKRLGVEVADNVARLVTAAVAAFLFFGEQLIPPEQAPAIGAVIDFVFYVLALFGVYGSAKAVGLVAPKA